MGNSACSGQRVKTSLVPPEVQGKRCDYKINLGANAASGELVDSVEIISDMPSNALTNEKQAQVYI